MEKCPIIHFLEKENTRKEFVIPRIEDYMKLVDLNYNCSQLKRILRHYKLKISGNKNEKVFRLYNYLKYSYYTRKIQSMYRKHMINKYIKLKGDGLKKSTMNSTDFLTLKEIIKLDFDQFFSYKDGNGNIWGFNIKSIWNLVINSKSRMKYQTHIQEKKYQ